MSDTSCGAIILAGGKRALREETDPHVPKLLEVVEGVPVLGHVINSFLKAIPNSQPEHVTVVISTRFEGKLRGYLTKEFPGVKIAVQQQHDGTARAVMAAIDQGAYPKTSHVMILMGDQPLFTPVDFFNFYKKFLPHEQYAGILAFHENRRKEEFLKCGKIFRDSNNAFTHIQSRVAIEASTEMLHAGPYMFDALWLKSILATLKKWTSHHNDEVHLYEALAAAAKSSGVAIMVGVPATHCLGVDTLSALEEVRRRMAARS